MTRKSTPIVDNESILMSLHDGCIGSLVLATEKMTWEHLDGHIGEAYEMAFASFNVAFVEPGEQGITDFEDGDLLDHLFLSNTRSGR